MDSGACIACSIAGAWASIDPQGGVFSLHYYTQMPFLLVCGDAPNSYCPTGSNIEEAALQGVLGARLRGKDKAATGCLGGSFWGGTGMQVLRWLDCILNCVGYSKACDSLK